MSPLAGKRVVVTRAAHQAEELARPLRALGAEVILLPVIEIAAPEDPEPLRRAAQRCDEYDWIIFASTNAVEAFTAVMGPGKCRRPRVATVGAATRRACEEHGMAVRLTPVKYMAEALVGAFKREDLRNKRVLIPGAAVTRDVIAPELRKLGAFVEIVEAYRNVIPSDAANRTNELLREPFPDWVLFASSSAAANFAHLAGLEQVNRMRVGSIGPATTATALQLGICIAVEAESHDIAGLVQAVASFDGPPKAPPG